MCPPANFLKTACAMAQNVVVRLSVIVADTAGKKMIIAL